MSVAPRRAMGYRRDADLCARRGRSWPAPARVTTEWPAVRVLARGGGGGGRADPAPEPLPHPASRTPRPCRQPRAPARGTSASAGGLWSSGGTCVRQSTNGSGRNAHVAGFRVASRHEFGSTARNPAQNLQSILQIGPPGTLAAMVHLRIVSPPDLTDAVIDVLDCTPSVVNIVRLGEPARRPDGDMILCDVAREDASVILSDLKDLGVHENGLDLARGRSTPRSRATPTPPNATRPARRPTPSSGRRSRSGRTRTSSCPPCSCCSWCSPR